MSVHPLGAEQDNQMRKNSRPFTAYAKFAFSGRGADREIHGLMSKGGDKKGMCPDAGHIPISSVFNAEAWSIFETEVERQFLRAWMEAAAAPPQEAVLTGSDSASGV